VAGCAWRYELKGCAFRAAATIDKVEDVANIVERITIKQA